ncbi:zinc finger, CCHC-type containing protein [Tanacetum coccineum]
MAKLQKDILMFQQRQDESLYDTWTRFKDLLQKVPHHGLDLWLQVQIFYDHVSYTTQIAIDYAAGGRLRKLRSEEAWETIEDLAQHEEEEWNDPIFFEKESPDYIDATLEQELESMECRIESLMRNEVLLEYEVGFTFAKRPYQEELEARILNLIDHQEDQVRKLEEDMRKTKDTFMCLAGSLIATPKVEIEAQRVHQTKIEKITRFHTHTPIVTPEILKPIMVHRVSMISNIKITIYRTPHQYLNSNLKMPIVHSFEENKLEYKDKDEVEIKMMGIGIDKESLEHNHYENDITPIIRHNFSPTLNLPIKPKDSGSFRMKVVEPLTIHTPPSPHVAYLHRNDKTTTLHQILEEVVRTECGDGVGVVKLHLEVLRRPHQAMNMEMQSMNDNEVWSLIDLPSNVKIVRSKWLFKKKADMQGNVHTYKARLLAKSYTQTYRLNYEETLSPVKDIKAIRILLAIATFYD